MNKFRVELWRIAKFLLITFAVTLPFSLVYNLAVTAIIQGSFENVSEGTLLSAASYGYTFFHTLVLVLLQRYFTFRATEKWYIAVPIMLLAMLAWQLLKVLPTSAAANISAAMLSSVSSLLSVIWIVLSYLLQRYVIYSHTTDTNGWYRRFHPTNDEKGE